MALKDWRKNKRTDYDEWNHKNNIGEIRISDNIERYSYKIKNYSLYIWDRNTDRPQISKTFQGKIQALKFAKAYMRTH